MSLMLRIMYYSSPFVDLAVFGLQNSLFFLLLECSIHQGSINLRFYDLSLCESKQKYPTRSICFQNFK